MVRQHHLLNGHEIKETGRQWRTAELAVLQSMGSQRVGHDLVTKQE